MISNDAYTTFMKVDEVSQICFGHNARMAARAVTRAYDARMQSIGLRITQFGVLVAIGNKEDASAASIARALDIESSAIVRSIELLKKSQLVCSDSGRGRRGQRLFLSAEGKRKLRQALRVWAEAQKEIENLLGNGRAETLQVLFRLQAAANLLEKQQK